MNYRLKKISGDASFREFYRLKKGNITSIIVQANKEKFRNLITYSVINKILRENKINAPRLLSNHYKFNMIEIFNRCFHHLEKTPQKIVPQSDSFAA